MRIVNKATESSAIENALVRLNWHYGRGDIIRVSVSEGKAYRTSPSCETESFVFTVRTRTVSVEGSVYRRKLYTVRALGHQRTVGVWVRE